MSAELVVQRTALDGAGDREREAQLLVYLTNAQQASISARGATERFEVVRDVQALSAMAKAYRLSDEAARKIGETSVLCLRLFGLALREIYPGESNFSNRERSAVTGASPGVCQHASVLATYSEEAVLAAFDAVRDRNQPAAFKYVYAALRDASPRVQRFRARKAVVSVVGDPDRRLIDAIWKKVDRDPVAACREILRLSREVVALKAQLAAQSK